MMSQDNGQKPAFDFGISDADLLNNDPRCPTLLLLDASGSMSGAAIKELQTGVTQYVDELAADPLARRRVEVAIVSFGGGVEVAHSFAAPDQFATPLLEAEGDTPMGKAIVTGLDLLAARKAELARKGIPQYRAWVFLITDGSPTDEQTREWVDAVRRIREGETKRSFLFFAVGVQGADFRKLKELCVERAPVALDGLRFRDLFQWLSASQKMVSTSQPGDAVPLPKVDWGSISA